MLERRLRALRVDVLDEPHLPLERAVLDLHLLVGASRRLRPLALAGDHEQPLAADDDAHGARVDARQLDDDRQRVRLFGVEAVDVRPEPVARSGEARHVPEIGEQLLDLLSELVVVLRAIAERYRHASPP